jgi:hypothetical protein
MDVCNMGIFANEMTIGAGKLFDSQGSLMLELTYSIFAQISPKWGIGLVTGYYDFSNEYYDSSKSFYGFDKIWTSKDRQRRTFWFRKKAWTSWKTRQKSLDMEDKT